MEPVNNEKVTYMDFTIESPEGRVEKVKEIIENTPSERLTPDYLTKLADYIIFAMDKKERLEKKILTENRLVTVNKRETSFEGLVGKLENGEDGIYNMIANDKNIIFQPKKEITEEDLQNIPVLKDLVAAIAVIEEKAKNARGRNAFLLRKQLIALRQDQYIIKSSYNKPIYCLNKIKSMPKIDLASEKITIDPKTGEVTSTGLVNFFNPEHISILLRNYAQIKEDTWDKLNSDAKWMLMDLENLVDKTLKEDYPMYYDLVILKIDGCQNAEIQEKLYEKYGVKHSVEYISSLWRNKIPKLIANQATVDYLEWHYTIEEKGKWKKCSRCGQIKLAHNLFFSKNATSRDGYYSICKCCRNRKSKEK